MAAAMYLSRGTLARACSELLPRVLPAVPPPYWTRSPTISWSSILPTATISIPTISLNIPGLLSDIWEGVLRAVPKKKTSHMKKRHRQLAGKALKDVRSIVACPGCGKPKKAHTLCPYCVAEIQQSWKEAERATKAVKQA